MSSFPHYFIYIFLTSGVKLHIHLLNVVVQFIVFLTHSTLICRSADISKCFSESLGIRDNESRLYNFSRGLVYFQIRKKVLFSSEMASVCFTFPSKPFRKSVCFIFPCSTQLSMKFVLLLNLKLLATANSFLLHIAEHEKIFAN